jgi:hypothetical protein
MNLFFKIENEKNLFLIRENPRIIFVETMMIKNNISKI